ncbi:glycosylhydrolase family 61-2 [Drechslerella dactyloides]|uniref:Glycosylhydrolase family 61-2 n=1 Tax=Drechslerella dactyloides TaxID=74499 RepID=A0AAD6IZG3_DREDA|nr:glycosylhydrolase family 61-2 [Drechslerella dactyloides]
MKVNVFAAIALLAVGAAAVTPTPAPTVAQVFGQCGGSNWAGPTKCVSGHVCSTYNPYYAQVALAAI